MPIQGPPYAKDEPRGPIADRAREAASWYSDFRWFEGIAYILYGMRPKWMGKVDSGDNGNVHERKDF